MNPVQFKGRLNAFDNLKIKLQQLPADVYDLPIVYSFFLH